MGQAFLYNAFFFTDGDTLGTFFDVKQTGYFIAVFAVSNFAGALMLSPLFDRIGRVQMIAGGIVEAFLGVKAEGQLLENIAKPLTAEEDADDGQRQAPQPA